MFLDQPYEGPAPTIVREIEKIPLRIKELGITTVLVEQNAAAALRLADRAIIPDVGQVVCDGSAREGLDNAGLRQQYLAI